MQKYQTQKDELINTTFLNVGYIFGYTIGVWYVLVGSSTLSCGGLRFTFVNPDSSDELIYLSVSYQR